jgi:hypothetical protein
VLWAAALATKRDRSLMKCILILKEGIAYYELGKEGSETKVE